MRPRRKGRWLPDGLGVKCCPVCWYRMDPVLAKSGLDRHPLCSGRPDGSRVQERFARPTPATVHRLRPMAGTPAGAVESALKAEGPGVEPGPSAGRHDRPVTPTPDAESKAFPVAAQNRRENAR